MKRCLVITGGTVNPMFCRSFLEREQFDMTAAVDGGLAVAKVLGICPDLVVGDFDTASEEILEEYRKIPGIAWEQHQAEKDETDTELALNAVREAGCTHIVILGATGGRMDHAIGNIHLLYECLRHGTQASIVDEKNRIYILDRGKTFYARELWGNYISFLPLTEEVHGITLTGFKYPLYEKNIRIGTSLCISNELTGESGSISFCDGVLICVESHD